jgi:Tol biopolymer transport system component
VTRSAHRPAVCALLFAGSLLLAFHPLSAQAIGGEPQWNGEGFGKNKIQYREFKWQIYHSPHFNVHYYLAEENLLQKVVSFAESAYDQLSRSFNYQIQEPVPLLFYATHSAFEQNNVILNFIPEGTGAFASPVRFRMVLPVDVPDPQLMQLVLHELTHIFQYHILFQGSLTRGLANGPPTWFIEGMASYMAKDETSRDRMYLRDAVVNDRIPSIRQDFEGFFAYRFGHAVFDFIEDRWGKEGFLDFLYEFRNTLGSRVDRAVKRTFKLDADEFDLEFRRWLRKKYLPELVQTGEPGDFGRVFRLKPGQPGEPDYSEQLSPSASPSGDLVAAVAAYRGDVDVVLFDARKRTFIRSLTKGFTNAYQYLVTQELRLGRGMGRDIAFSPDGNSIAVFAKRERGRSLVLLDVLHGGIRRIVDTGDIEQQLGPAWSPDGRKIAFSGYKGGQFDIFLFDLETQALTNVTNDEVFDGAPAFSPDGKSMVFVSVVGDGYGKLFRIDFDKPGQRFQLTTGKSNENDPIYSPDGKRIYFTSDRNGQQNIYSLDPAAGELRQYTNAVTGAFMPTVLKDVSGKERLVFGGFWKGKFDLYVTDVDAPLGKPETVQVAAGPTTTKELPHFEPDIQVTIDNANKGRYGGFKFFLEGASSYVAVDSNQTYLGQVLLTFSDYLGNRRILTAFSSIDSFSNFDFIYLDLSRRTQWQLQLFDERQFYVVQDFVRQELRRERTAYQVTGLIASLVYPFSFYNRAELGAGYIYRKINFQGLTFDPVTGEPTIEFIPFSDNFPLLQGVVVGDTSLFAQWGPVSGHRVRVETSYAPNVHKASGESSTLFVSTDVDARQYLPVTQRSNLAMRIFAGTSNGERPNPFYFGGLDTLRGTDLRSFSGDRAFFANLEYRFPLLDLVATPIVAFQGIRGAIFLDVGGAYFHNLSGFQFYDSNTGRLRDGVAAYGWGFTVRLLGLDLNWDFARQWDFKQSGGYTTAFWIGTRF